MGFVSDIIGGIGANNAANQASQAAQQDTNSLNQVYGQLGSIVNNADSQYYGAGGGASLLNGLGQYLQGGLSSGYSNPNLTSAMRTAGTLAGGGNNPYMSAAGGTASQLQNFNGLKPQELAALQQSTANSGMSTINTLRGSMAGGANNNALISNLIGQNNQNTLAQGIQLGGQAAGQELGAQESAGQLQSGLSGQQIGAMGSGMQGQLSGSAQNLDYLSQMIQGLLGTTGQQAGLLSGGMGSLGQMGGQYANMASGAATQAQNDRNTAMSDFTGAANNIASLVAAPFTGGASAATGMYNGFNVGNSAGAGAYLDSVGQNYGG